MGMRELWLNVVLPWQERRRLEARIRAPPCVPGLWSVAAAPEQKKSSD